ncbi:MAG: signal peptidase I [Nanoarchaeota archaeon]|nr:signal peptidase I [Nanoarchaeota archaeon]
MKKLFLGIGIGIILSCLVLTFIDFQNTNTSLNMPLSFSGNSIAVEKNSPADRIKQSDIHVLNDKVVIDIENPEWAMFTDTNSMDPLFDSGSNAIELVPKSEQEIQAGDIVSYKSEYADGIIIHRVAKIGTDEDGWFAVMKGDNNPTADPGKVRFDQIQRVVVAIVY